MPQARLPDVNTAFNTHRKRAILAIEAKNWTEAIGALYAFNGALPLEYRVIISDEKYSTLLKKDLMVTCKHCKTSLDYQSIKILNVITSDIERLISRQKTVKLWQCPNCRADNRLAETGMEQSVLAQPYYLGVISKPPTRTDDLASHITYDKVLERWCWTMLDELEERAAQYRDDNWKKEDDEQEGFPIDTSWEDADD